MLMLICFGGFWIGCYLMIFLWCFLSGRSRRGFDHLSTEFCILETANPSWLVLTCTGKRCPFNQVCALRLIFNCFTFTNKCISTCWVYRHNKEMRRRSANKNKHICCHQTNEVGYMHEQILMSQMISTKVFRSLVLGILTASCSGECVNFEIPF